MLQAIPITHSTYNAKQQWYTRETWDLEESLLQKCWVAQSTDHPTLGFGSGHDLMACGFKTLMRLRTVSEGPAWDSLLLSLPLPHLHTFSQNK